MLSSLTHLCCYCSCVFCVSLCCVSLCCVCVVLVSGFSQTLADINPGGWVQGCKWNMFYGMDTSQVGQRLVRAVERRRPRGEGGGAGWSWC